ncbi:hypothetical protein M3Y97_01073700 [Aphelenchoides bicaudatus]|nr:hypothetical protein M3Y97_01073700 [Aphelenchoides bicaudatus]
MEILIFEPAKFNLLYNCTFYNYSTIPLQQRKHQFLGGVIIASYVVFCVSYLFCLYAMVAAEHFKKASYRLMFLLGVIHVLDLQFCGLMTGIFAIIGAVYCEYPMLIYISGGIAVACWCASTMTSMILGINRCFELWSSEKAHLVFGEWRILIWYLVPTGYFMFILFYSPPGIYYGVQLAWFFNPHIGYYEDYDLRYKNVPHTINNFILCLTESLIYLTLIGLYIRATQFKSSESRLAIRRERKIYIQVILVGTIHFIAGASYVIMQFVPVNFYGTLVASTFYLLSQGFPPIIYLSMNKTLRNVLKAKFGLRTHVKPSRSTAGSTAHVRQLDVSTEIPSSAA